MGGLQDLNRKVQEQIDKSAVRFVFEAEIALADLDFIKESFRAIIHNSRDQLSSAVRSWTRNHPTLLLFLMVGVAREKFNSDFRGFWKNFYGDFGVTEQSSNINSILGDEFLKELRRRHLESRIEGYLYVGPILVHTGLPETDYKEFISYLTWLEPSVRLDAFARISNNDFNDLVAMRGQPKTFSSRLSTMLGQDEGRLVLWQIGTLVGECASYSEGSCPEEWLGTIRERLINVIKSLSTSTTAKKVRQINLGQYPYICWQPDLQRVVAFLPAQSLPKGISLRLGGVLAGCYPFCRQVGDCTEVEGVESEAFGAHEVVKVEVNYLENNNLFRSFNMEYSFVNETFCLFHSDGSFIPLSSPLEEGTYLLLTRVEMENSSSVEIRDWLDEPAGWRKWHGYEIRVKVGANLGNYKFTTDTYQMRWELADKPRNKVLFNSAIPVWVNDWPDFLIWNSTTEAIEDAYLEIKQCDSGKHVLETRNLRVKELSLILDENNYVRMSLKKHNELAGLSGLLFIRIYHPFRKVITNELAFLRLDGVNFAYEKFTFSSELSISTLVIRGRDMRIELRSGELVKQTGEQEYFLMPSDPVSLPEVGFRLHLVRGFSLDLNCRVPVTRSKHITGTSLGEWRSPPISLSLYDVGLEDVLRVELESPAELVQNELTFRLAHGSLIREGKPYLQPNVFEIRLSRWRDIFGPAQTGLLQVYHEGKWLDLVHLTDHLKADGQNEVAAGLAEDVDVGDKGSFDPISVGILEAIKNLNKEEMNKYILQAMAACADPQTPLPYVKHYWPLIVRGLFCNGRFKDLDGFLESLVLTEDIPEIHLYYFQALLRRGILDEAKLNELDNRVKCWSEGLEKRLLLAEISYHLSRMEHGSVFALKVTRRYLRDLYFPDQVLRMEALVLDSVAAFLMQTALPIVPSVLQRRMENEFLNTLAYANDYLRFDLQQWRLASLNSIKCNKINHRNLELDIVMRSDQKYIELCLFQAANDVAQAGHLIDDFAGANDMNYAGIELVKARQALLTGDLSLARKLYKPLHIKYPNALGDLNV